MDWTDWKHGAYRKYRINRTPWYWPYRCNRAYRKYGIDRKYG